jgi:hypothetical protein
MTIALMCAPVLRALNLTAIRLQEHWVPDSMGWRGLLAGAVGEDDLCSSRRAIA